MGTSVAFISSYVENGHREKWFDEKGFGFIGQDDGGDDLFCHRSHLSGADSLECDAKVRFDEFWDDRKGKMRADNVSMVDGGGGKKYSSYGGDGGSNYDSKGKGHGGYGGDGYGGRDRGRRERSRSR